MNTIGITVGLKFGVQTLKDGRSVPYVSTIDLNIDIDRFDIKVHVHGNIWADFADMFTIFFKKEVVNVIQETLTVTLETGVPYVCNKVLDSTDGYFPVPVINNWIIDWETPKSAVVSSEYFSIGIKGLFFDSKHSESS